MLPLWLRPSWQASPKQASQDGGIRIGEPKEGSTKSDKPSGEYGRRGRTVVEWIYGGWWSEVGRHWSRPRGQPLGLARAPLCVRRNGTGGCHGHETLAHDRPAPSRHWRISASHREQVQATASHSRLQSRSFARVPLLFSGFWCVCIPPPPPSTWPITPRGFGGLGFYFEVFRVALYLPPIGAPPRECCYLK